MISEEVIGDHRYNAWVVKGNWKEEIAKQYRNLRTSTRFPIEPICYSGIGCYRDKGTFLLMM